MAKPQSLLGAHSLLVENTEQKGSRLQVLGLSIVTVAGRSSWFLSALGVGYRVFNDR